MSTLRKGWYTTHHLQTKESHEAARQETAEGFHQSRCLLRCLGLSRFLGCRVLGLIGRGDVRFSACAGLGGVGRKFKADKQKLMP